MVIKRTYQGKSTVFHATKDDMNNPIILIISEDDYQLDTQTANYLKSIYPALEYHSGLTLPIADFFDALAMDSSEVCTVLEDDNHRQVNACIEKHGIDKYLSINGQKVALKDLYKLFMLSLS